MNKVYTGLEIGENTIKIATFKEVYGNLKLLASAEVKTKGISKGRIIDAKLVAKSLNAAKKDLENKLGIEISKIVLSIKPYDTDYKIASVAVNTIDPNMISGADITNLIKASLKENIRKDYELITAFPIGYKLDNGKIVNNPKGKKSKKIFSRIVLASEKKDYLYKYLTIINMVGFEVTDIVYDSVADYYAVRNKTYDEEVGVIIDIGEEETGISVFNKGIMVKKGAVPIGSRHVDSDISYIYKIGLKDARKLKESYALASSRYADKYDSVTLKDENGENIEISQLKLTEIVSARLKELLNLSKKEIKNLTNRKISYIIILGGLSEMTGFNYLASHILGDSVVVWSSTTIGLRHNKYGTVIGTVKYFKDKLELRSKSLSMIDSSEYDELKDASNKDALKNIMTENA